MLQIFRNFFKSKLGVGVTLAFLLLIAIAFGAGDIAHMGTFGGISGGDRVAIVGDRKIANSELVNAVRNDFEQYRRQVPTATMESFVAAGGLSRSLDQLIDRTALAQYGVKYGMRAGNRLVDSELVQFAAFKGADGKFDQQAYRAALAQQGISDEALRADIANGLLARQVLMPLSLGSSIPPPLVKRYAALLRERRTGSVGLLLSDAYAPKNDPTDAQIDAYYKEHRTDYLRPERRVIRYATFDEKALGNLPAPTEAEIAARYKQDAALYAASELRQVTQLVVPTKAVADEIAAQVSAGKPLDAAARERGLATTRVGPIAQSALAEQASDAVAKAAFAAPQGGIAATARGALGYYVVRVDNIQRTPARSLDQVRGAILTTLQTEKRGAALSELSAQIEEELDNGASLAEVAKKRGLTVATTPEILADGRVYGKAGETAPPILKTALSNAFDMQEGEPELAEITAGQTFLIYDVSEIVPSTAAPLSEIRDTVKLAWKRSEGDKAAKLAADRVLKRVQQGETVAAAMAKESVQLPPVDPINMDREQLSKLGGRVPPVLALMFSMAEGTSKRLEAPNDNGWFVVKLDKIEPGKLAPDDPMIAAAGKQLGQVAAEEAAQQLSRAIKAELGVERNQAAIEAVRVQLTGGSVAE